MDEIAPNPLATVPDIIAFLGGKAEIAKLIGVSTGAVRIAEVNGEFPAAWFHAMESKARRRLPRELFSFKGAAQ